jgi:Nif-specific regulatory protein
MVQKGEFRSDLYYRLNVLPLFIPPLRQRTEDIPELARFFLSKFTRFNKRQFKGFSESALEALLTYSWPGNIRELENCVERACVTANGKWIQKEDLSLELEGGSPKFGIPGSGSPKGGRSLKAAEKVFKANFIRKVLDENGWNQTETAKALDIQRTYLSRLIKELNLNKE